MPGIPKPRPTSPSLSHVAPSHRVVHIATALRLSYFTLAWNGVIGAIGLIVALFTGSLALAGFALSAVLDASASAVLVWRFLHERRDPKAADRAERRARGVVAGAMLAVALSVGVQSIRALVNDSHAHASVLAFAVAAVSLLVLPWLGRQKLRVAAELSSGALRGDGMLTLAGATLAAITLAALVVTAALGWRWADSTAALLIAIGLAAEGVRVVRREHAG